MIPPDTLLKRGTIDLQAPVSLGGKSYTWHPYAFSWRWGVEDDPGHQGYHGLKEEVHDEFIRLGKPVQAWKGAPTVERQAEEGGNFYCLFTGVLSPAEGNYEVRQGAVRPMAIRINGMPIDTAARAVPLRAGLNTLMLWYNRQCMTYFVLQKPGGTGGLRPGVSVEDPEAKPLAMRWYGDPTVLRFDARFGEKVLEGWYTFLSAPGMKRMRFAVHGNVEVLVGGRPMHVTKGPLRADGTTACEVDLDETATAPVEVVFHVAQERGYYGGSAIPDPVQLECFKGVYETGDWSRNDALYAYSGGARYSRSVFLDPEETTRKVELNLGSVISSAEVWVNGKNVGVKTAPPWVYDISRFVRTGDNSIEVLVYNTAANHYTSIPTMYRGSITSGLLGPVTLDLTERVVLKARPQSLHDSEQGKR
jgi:hypothetical protein